MRPSSRNRPKANAPHRRPQRRARTRTQDRRRARAFKQVAIGTAVVAAFAGFLVWQRAESGGSNALSVVAVEPEPGRQAQEAADVGAELASIRTGRVLVTGVAGSTADPALNATFDCPAADDTITCQERQAATAASAQSAATRLLEQAPAPAPDPFAPVIQVAQYVGATTRPETVALWLNVTAPAAAGPLALALGTGPTAADAARQLIQVGSWVASCRDWAFHLVVPSTGDLETDTELREMWADLAHACGGKLASWTQRWLATSPKPMVLPRIPGAQVSADGYTLAGDVTFATNEATLLPQAVTTLDAVASALVGDDVGVPVIVTGYTDDTGTAAFDQQLSTERAQAVAAFLSNRGVSAQLLSAQGCGASDFVASNATAEGRAQNRRVDIILDPGGAGSSPCAAPGPAHG